MSNLAAPAKPDTPAAGHPTDSRRWWILAVLGVANLMVVLDATVVNIALPFAQSDLGFDDGDRQWIVTGYSLAFGSLLLLGGRLADLFGRKRMFLIGVVGFAAASAVGGAAPNFEVLVTARAIQGAFGAVLAPAALALLMTTFTEPRDRAKAFGVYSGIAGAGASIGLLLGGVLTEYLDWRWTMYVNVIFAVLAAVGGLAWLTHTLADERPRLDVRGTVIVSLSMFAIVYGFANAAGNHGWGDLLTYGPLAAGAVLLIAFVATQRRTPNPLLPLRVVTDRNRAAAYLAMFMASIGMFGVFLFLTYYLAGTLHYTPLKIGLAFLPLSLLVIVVSGVGNTVLVHRFSPRLLIGPGLLLAALGMLLLTRVELHSGYVTTVLPALLAVATGMGLVFAPAFTLGTSGVAPQDAGVASATINVAQQIGGSIGTALLNTIATTAAADFVATHATRGVTPGILAGAALHSYHVAFWTGAAVFFAAVLIVIPLLRRGIPDLAAHDAGAKAVALHA